MPNHRKPIHQPTNDTLKNTKIEFFFFKNEFVCRFDDDECGDIINRFSMELEICERSIRLGLASYHGVGICGQLNKARKLINLHKRSLVGIFIYCSLFYFRRFWFSDFWDVRLLERKSLRFFQDGGDRLRSGSDYSGCV